MSASIYCPHCHKHTALSVAQHIEGNYQDKKSPCIWKDRNSWQWWIGICNSCHSPSLVCGNGEIIYPTPRPTPTDSNIPEELAQDLDESKLCFVTSCYRGCAVLARRAIQQACIKKGANPDKNLVQQINDMVAAGVITKDVGDSATAIRWIGNDAAHPDPTSTVEKEDAEDCLKLAEQFLHVVFVTPALAQARHAARKK